MKLPVIITALFAALVAGGLVYKSNSTPAANVEQVAVSTTTSATATNLATATKAGSTASREILKFKVDTSRVVYLNTDVNQQSSKAVIDKLKKLENESDKPIWLLINSPGGEIFSGGQIVSQVEASKAPVYTVCTGMCASMAAMLHSYGKKRYALDRALLMYHPAAGGTQGQIPNMISLLNTIQRFVDKMNANVINRSKVSKEEYDTLVAYEFWIDSEDAFNKGLLDGVVNLNVPSEDPNAPPTISFPEHEEEKKGAPKRRRLIFNLISNFTL